MLLGIIEQVEYRECRNRPGPNCWVILSTNSILHWVICTTRTGVAGGGGW